MLHGKSRVLGGVLPAVCALLSPVPGERRVYVLESDICPFLSQTFEHLPPDYHGPGASHLGSNNSASEAERAHPFQPAAAYWRTTPQTDPSDSVDPTR